MEKQNSNISCNNVALDVFIDCDVNENYSRLKEGATDDELKEIWSRLCAEYMALFGSKGYTYKFNLHYNILLLNSRIKAAAIGFMLPEEDAKAYWKQLEYYGDAKYVEALIKRDMVLMADQNNELEKMQSGDANQKKITVQDYYEWIATVSKYMGFNIDEKTTTVAMFAAYNSRISKENKKK